MLNGLINQQSAMIAYIDDFKLMFWITLAAAPLLLIMRYQKPTGAPAMAQQPAAVDGRTRAAAPSTATPRRGSRCS